MRRALERASVRDLRAARREEYRAQDAAEQERIAELRAERNAVVDALDREANAVNTARELALAAERNAWVDACAHADELRRAANAAIAADRARNQPLEEARIAELRAERNAVLDRLDEEEAALNEAYCMMLVELRTAWNEARGRAIDAKRAMRVALRELRGRREATRPEREAAAAAERRERNEAWDRRWEAVRAAVVDYEFAAAQLRCDEREGSRTASEMDASRAEVSRLRAAAEKLESEARATDLAVEDAFLKACRDESTDAAMAESALREEWLDARHQVALEGARARTAVREFQQAASDDDEAAHARVRERRREANERFRQAVEVINRARELREADLRAEYLEARAAERRAHEAARAAERAFKAENGAGYEDELARIRRQRLEAEEKFSRTVYQINMARELSRADEREQARGAAGAVLDGYRASLQG